MSRAIVASILVSTIAFASAASAGGPSAAAQIQKRQDELHLERVKEDPRYLQTRQLCENNWREYGWVLKESASEVLLLGTAYVPAWSRFFKNDRIAPEVKDLLDSESFTQGLRDCGNDYSVISKMAAADYAGKAVGLAATYAMYRGGGPAMMRLGQMGRAGSIAQRAIFMLSAAYTVQQVITLVSVLSQGKKPAEETKALVDQKVRSLSAGIGNMKESVERGFRQQLELLESHLREPNLTDDDRAATQAKIDRIHAALKS